MLSSEGTVPMSGFLVLIGCLAVVTLIAVPTIARASGSPGKTPATVQVAAVDAYLKLDGLITFQKVDGSVNQYLKLSQAQCTALVVVAHKGDNLSGPVVARGNAMPGKDPGSCVYSLKVPAGEDVTVEVLSWSWGSTKVASADYLKISSADKLAWTWNKQSTGEYVKVGIKGESSPLTVIYDKHKGASEVTMPIYVKLMPT